MRDRARVNMQVNNGFSRTFTPRELAELELSERGEKLIVSRTHANAHTPPPEQYSTKGFSENKRQEMLPRQA